MNRASFEIYIFSLVVNVLFKNATQTHSRYLYVLIIFSKFFKVILGMCRFHLCQILIIIVGLLVFVNDLSSKNSGGEIARRVVREQS